MCSLATNKGGNIRKNDKTYGMADGFGGAAVGISCNCNTTNSIEIAGRLDASNYCTPNCCHWIIRCKYAVVFLHLALQLLKVQVPLHYQISEVRV